MRKQKFDIDKRHIIEKSVLRVLKQYGRSPTTKLAFLVLGSTETRKIRKILDEMERSNFIIKEEEVNATYWKIRWTFMDIN